MWNRFKTVAAIEGAMLYGLYQMQNFHEWQQRIVALVGSLFVFLSCLLTVTDRITTRDHLSRIQRFEQGSATFVTAKPKWLKAEPFLFVSAVLLNAVNLMLFISVL